jgi:flavodoxin I
VQSPDLGSNDLLVVGSPTPGGRPTPVIQDFVNKLPDTALKGKRVATFDTRFSSMLVGIFGYAAER